MLKFLSNRKFRIQVNKYGMYEVHMKFGIFWHWEYITLENTYDEAEIKLLQTMRKYSDERLKKVYTLKT